MLPPGSTIGILGGGQLGRMMALAALQLGYKVIGFAPEGDNVAADASSDFITADWADAAALAAFTGRCDVVTWEFENVPLSTVAVIPPALLACPARALEVAQDRLSEKAFIADLGGTSAPYARVENGDDFARALQPHCFQHVTGPQRARGTGASGRYRNALPVKADQLGIG